ncbi:hypothetical protein SAMN04487980_1001312 [Streptomyces sp. cf124]|uniref:hypothetical protein n=1 Tax=Streptomyces sp. cf124 TaxID=1761903 RepID=UPI0008EB7208|nr:hypothetical protein [Streptomyces sp. cf124]SFM44146.1 hypothetical protein SAMN04487980_1001312 [Streptomyces sp. cf124]
MSAVCSWHEEQGRSKPNMRGARAVLNAYKDRLAEAKEEAAQARQATAALPTQIGAILADVDRTTLAGKRNAALVLLGFATAARVSELVALDVSTVVEAEHGYDVTLYRKKVRKHTPNPILYGSDAATCPSGPCAPTSPPSRPPGAPRARCSSASTGVTASPRPSPGAAVRSETRLDG